MELSIFILDVINKVLGDKNEVYNCAHVGAQGDDRQSVHRGMHKIPVGHGVLTMFYAEKYDLATNNGTDTIILLESRAGLPHPRNPVPPT